MDPNKSYLPIALAACAFSLSVDASGMARVQVMPAGRFHPTDGRPLKSDGWFIDAANARAVIDKFRERKTPMVVDYEHQTLLKDDNGQPAPAAAWFTDLVWEEGQGLFATLELTPRAREAVANNEYRFFSPVFNHDAKSGAVSELLMGALTNTPALDGMDAVTLQAAAARMLAACASDDPQKGVAGDETGPDARRLLDALTEAGMSFEAISERLAAMDGDVERSPSVLSAIARGVIENPPENLVAALEQIEPVATASTNTQLEDTTVTLIEKLNKLLGLKKDATEDQAMTALSQRLDTEKQLRVALNLEQDAGADTLVAACTALKAKAEGGEPDPAQFVPVSALRSVQGEVAALSRKLQERDQKDVNTMIDAALEDGRLVKSLEGWARDLGKKDQAALSQYLAGAEPLAALAASQTGGQPPVDTDTGLTEDELAVCKSMNLAPEAFKKVKGVQTQAE